MAYNTTILADSPLIYFQLNETSGTTFANSGSVGGTSSAIGSGVTKGITGGIDGSNAIALDGGANGYVSAASTPNFMSDNQFSVEAWVKTTVSGAKTIVSYNPGSRGFTLGTNSSNRATFSITNNNGTSSVTASGSTALINDGNWHHIVATAASATLTIYVDGVSTQNTSALGGTYGITGTFYIGQSGSGGFNGNVDEVALYDNALTSTQVTTHYNANPVGTNGGYTATAMTASADIVMPAFFAQKQVSYAASAMTASGSAVMPSVAGTDGRTPISANPDVDLLWSSNDGADTIFLFNGTSNYTLIKMDDINFGSNPALVIAQLVLKLTTWNTTSWTITPITQSWTSSGVPNPTVDATKAITIPSANVTPLGNDFYSVDITSIANHWVNGTLTNYGVKITGAGNAARNQSPSSARTSYIQYSYRTDGVPANYSVGPMTASSSLAMPGVTAGTGVSVGSVAMTATASMVMPVTSVNAEYSATAMSANASMAMPSLVIPDRNVNADPMVANASMPGGAFTVKADVLAEVATASASMPDVSVSGELNAKVNANVMVAAATIIPPTEAQGNDADPYYVRLNSQVTQRGSLWYRLDETSGTVAVNERPDGTTLNNGTYVGGVTLGLSGLEGRKIARFDGVDDGIILPDNDGLVAGGTFEFVFRTTKATQTIVEGIDFNFNNFGGALRGTMIGLTNGKIDIFPSNAGQYTGLTTLNDGQWHHVVVTFYRFGNAALNYPGQLAVYVDGKVELKRYLLENQIFVAVPDSIGGIGSRAENITTTIGQRAASIPFEGDIMEFVFQPDKVINETEAIRNYYYAFGYNPIYVEPMTASASMPNVIGKGNQKRALALFWSTDTDENLNLPNYWDRYNWTGIRTSDTFAAVGPLLSHYRLSAPFDLGGFKVFPRSIQRNETASVNDYLGGAYYDYVTGEQRYIDLTTDIDVSDYDLVFFLNLPPQKASDVGGVADTPKNWESMVDSLREAQDAHGFSIWVPQPDLAAQLGIIDRWTVHSMLRETFVSDSQGNASGLYDARGPQINPWNNGGVEISDPKYYYDTHAANKYRIVSLLDDFTTLGGYIIDDYFYGRPRDPYKIPFEGWKYREIASGLQIGDEMYYPQDFWAIGGSSSWFGVHNQRRSVVAVPSENVKAGTILTKENDTHYVGTSEVANPFADYATSIVVKPGDTLKGRQANGKIYVNFMEGADGNFGVLRKQIVPPNEQITNPQDWEDASKRAWDYTSYRVSATAVSTGTGSQGPTGGAAQTPIGEGDAVDPVSGGDDIVGVNESEKYQVVFLTQHGMLERAFNWMSIRDEIQPGDKIVRPDIMTANASMAMPTVTGQKSATVNATAMLATAQMQAPTEAHGPDSQVLVLPMTAFANMVGVGRTISVEPMTALATMVDNFDLVHAGGEQIVLYLHYSDAIVYMKEDA